MPVFSIADTTHSKKPKQSTKADEVTFPQNPTKIGIVGLGSVGSAVVRQLCARADLGSHSDNVVISHVCVRDRHKPRDCTLPKETVYVDTPVEIVSAVDVVIEVAGGKDPLMAELYEAALRQKKPVVSANKAYLASYDFVNRALALNIPVGFEAAVAGGVPIMHTMSRILRVGAVGSLCGILNGTCNYILSTMEQDGQEYATALTSAQRRGFAEIDPTLDIDGTDTAHKIALLSMVAMGWHIDIDTIPIQGIANITALDFHHANSMSYTIRLIGQLLSSCGTNPSDAPNTTPTLIAEVAPMLVPHNSTFASTVGVDNAICATCPPLGTLTLRGPGAGGDATASAVISDLLDITQCTTKNTLSSRGAAVIANPHAYPYYVRLTVIDSPGVLAKIGQEFAREDISIHTLIQAEHQPNENEAAATVIIKTHPTTQNRITLTMKTISESGYTLGHPLFLRIRDES